MPSILSGSFYAGFFLSMFSCITDHNIPSESAEKSKLLTKKWAMLPVENGKDTLALVGSTFLMFVSDGTLKIQAMESPANPIITNMNWKWHSSNPDRIQYWNSYTPLSESYNHYTIRKLTADTLKLTQTRYFGDFKYTFVPAN